MYKKYTNDLGLTIVAEEINYVNSVTFGIWINVGSRIEDNKTNGLSHFIEHMLFKGSKNNNAKEIAEKIDNLGGQINAFTSKEYTCFYVKMLDEHIFKGIDIILDMILNPLFLEEDIEKEKSVILEELKMYEDSPDDLCHDTLFENMYMNKGIGMNILGTKESINNINKESILDFFKKFYTPNNSVISICGNFNFDDIVSYVENKLTYWENTSSKTKRFSDEKYKQVIIKKEKDIEQINLCMGLETVGLCEFDSYVLSVVNNIFGGSMSSRLFQNIREDLGVVYSIYSYPTLYKNKGILNISASIGKDNFDIVYKKIIDEIEILKTTYLTNDEIQKSKEQFKGNYILSLENTGNRMMSMGKSQLLFNKIETPKDIIDKINSITYDDVKRVIDKTFDKDKISSCIVGKDVLDIEI